jgi:hypothetical protein
VTLTEDAVTFDRPAPPRVVAALVVLILIAGTGFLIWAAHYQPLSTGGSSMEFGSPVRPALGAPTTQWSLDAVEFKTPWVVYPKKAGDKFGFVYGIENEGPYGVTLLGIGGPSEGLFSGSPSSQFSTASIRRNRPAWHSNSPDYSAPYYFRRFTPVSVGPRQPEFDMGVTWTYRGCPNGTAGVPSADQALINEDFTVTYRFLWFTHTALIPLHDSLYVADLPRC